MWDGLPEKVVAKPEESDSDDQVDDPWYLYFRCEITQKLAEIVILPTESKVFDQNYNQKGPLELKNEEFSKSFSEKIDWYNAYNKANRKKSSFKGEFDKHNKKLQNDKDHAIRAILRNHFSEFDLTYDQFKWLDGKLKVKVGKYERTCSFYSSAERRERHDLCKSKRMTTKDKEKKSIIEEIKKGQPRYYVPQCEINEVSKSIQMI